MGRKLIFSFFLSLTSSIKEKEEEGGGNGIEEKRGDLK